MKNEGKKWHWVFQLQSSSGILRIYFGSSVALWSSLHMVARWYWQLSLTSFHQILLKKACLFIYCSSKNSGLALITLICVPCFFPDLITVARGEENTAWPGLDSSGISLIQTTQAESMWKGFCTRKLCAVTRRGRMGRHKQWMFSTSFLKFQLWRLTICRNRFIKYNCEWHYYLITAKIMAQDILKLTYPFGKAYSNT